MSGPITTVLAVLLAFAAGGLFSTLFTTFDKSSENQGLATANAVLFVALAVYVKLDVLLLVLAVLGGAVVVGTVTEFTQ